MLTTALVRHRRRKRARQEDEYDAALAAPGRWGAGDTAFALLAVVTVVVYVVNTSKLVFTSDDWPLGYQSMSLSRFLDAYNGHLSIVPLAFYRVILSAVGLRTYLPFRLEFATALAGVAAAVYLAVRSRYGPLPALVVGTAFLWYHEIFPAPQAANHAFALTGSVLCAWALPRDGRKMDVFVGAALIFALCSSGVGVAAAAGCVAFVALTRPPVGRWVAVLVPTTAWLLWWHFVSDHPAPPLSRTFSQKVHFILSGFRASFDGLVAGNRVLGLVLLGIFVVTACWRARAGLQAVANQLSWTTALVVWWAGVASSRGLVAMPDTFRFRFVGSAFVVVAFLPTKESVARSGWASRFARDPAFVGLTLVVTGAIIAANAGGILDADRRLQHADQALVPYYLVANVGPEAIPNNGTVRDVPYLTAGQYREVVAHYDPAPGTQPTDADRAIVATVHMTLDPRPVGVVCRVLRTPQRVAPGMKVLGTTARPVVVQVRRFQAAWLTVGTIPKDKGASFTLPAFGSTTPWELRATGSCTIRI
jgi:hypothetical protein